MNASYRLCIYLTFCVLATTVSAQESAGPRPLENGRFVVTGYGDTTYEDGDSENSFFSTKVAPIFLFQLNDKLHVEAELEFGLNDEGETETELEYADLHYFLGDRTTLTAGKFLLPFGQFGPNLHPSWINRLPTAPGIYGGHGGNGLMSGVLPVLSDVGINFQYSANLGGTKRLFFDIYVVNGVSSEEDGHDEEGVEDVHDEDLAADAFFPEVEFEASGRDNNNDKAFGGRAAFAFLPELEVAASYYNGSYNSDGDLDFKASAVDFNWVGQYLAVRGEYIKTETGGLIEVAEEEDEHDEGPAELAEVGHEEEVEDDHDEEFTRNTFDKSGWYLQASWRLAQLKVDALNPVELVVRHSQIRGFDAGKRWTLGANYWLAPSAVLKLAYEDTNLDDGRNDTRLFVQVSYGF